jgi:hypothetical protein
MYDFSWEGRVSDGVLRKGFEFGEDVEAIGLREIDVDIGDATASVGRVDETTY